MTAKSNHPRRHNIRILAIRLSFIAILAITIPGCRAVSRTRTNFGQLLLVEDGRIRAYSLDENKLIDDPFPEFADHHVLALTATPDGSAIAVAHKESTLDLPRPEPPDPNNPRKKDRHYQEVAMQWDNTRHFIDVLTKTRSLTRYEQNAKNLVRLKSTTVPSGFYLSQFNNRISGDEYSTTLAYGDELHTLNWKTQEWSVYKLDESLEAGIIQFVGNDIYYLDWWRRVFKQTIGSNKSQKRHTARWPYSHLGTTWVRPDGKYLLYCRPNSAFWGGRGFEWVIFDLESLRIVKLIRVEGSQDTNPIQAWLTTSEPLAPQTIVTVP